MTDLTQTPEAWAVCERGDRWYRAVCRFVPEGQEKKVRFSIDRVPQESANLVLSLAKMKQGRVIVLWEFPADSNDAVARMESVATLRNEWPRAIQLASLPPNYPPNLCLAVQEAGVNVLLTDLTSLQKVVGTLSQARPSSWQTRP